MYSLTLAAQPHYFPQNPGPCYHYSPTTAALLYEVVMVRRRADRSRPRSGNLLGRALFDEAAYARSLNLPVKFAAIAHSTPFLTNAAKYSPTDDGYEWLQMNEVPWPGMPESAAIVHLRRLFCPVAAFRATQPEDMKIHQANFSAYLEFLHQWVPQQPYYFPALRQAEISAQAVARAILTMPQHMTLHSLPGFATLALFKEVGNARAPSPDLFDRKGNVVPSRTRIDPQVTVMRGGKHTARAQLVYELFNNGGEWEPRRADHSLVNDRIENIAPTIWRSQHPTEFVRSSRLADVVFPHKHLLPTSIHFTRGWRHGIERLAFDIDQAA